MSDPNVSAAARDFDAIEDSNERACHEAAARAGLSTDQADSCDNGEYACARCPWKFMLEPAGLTGVPSAAR